MSKQTKKGSFSKRKAPAPSNLETLGIKFEDQQSWDYFSELSKRTLQPTKFYHEEMVRDLGVMDEVRALIKGLGWENFITMNAKTYRRVTLEFLASARRNVVVLDGEDVVELSFQVFNNHHSLTADDINEHFYILTHRAVINNPVRELARDYDEQTW